MRRLSSDPNPYAPPMEAGEVPPRPSSIFVDGRYLVVGSDTTLPARCVLTNVTVTDEQPQLATLTWSPSFRLVIRARSCRIRYWVHPSLLARRQHKLLMFYVGLVAAVIAAGWYFRSFAAVTFCGLLINSLAKPRNTPLRLKTLQKGHFWIGGCCEEFLRQCEQEFGPYRDGGDDAEATRLLDHPQHDSH